MVLLDNKDQRVTVVQQVLLDQLGNQVLKEMLVLLDLLETLVLLDPLDNQDQAELRELLVLLVQAVQQDQLVNQDLRGPQVHWGQLDQRET
jgi:hypothetical protein